MTTKKKMAKPQPAKRQNGLAKPLPDGWRRVKLGDVLRVKSGSFLPARAMNLEGQYPVYGGNGISGYHDEYLFGSPQVVIGRVGALCGAIHHTSSECWITDNALYISERKMQFDDDFMVHLLRFLNLNRLSNSMAQPVISGKAIYGVEIPLPPIEEQRRIVAILRDRMAAIDQARQAAEAQLEAAIALPAAYLRQIFNSPEAQTWQKKPLGNIAETSSGSTPSRQRDDYYVGTIPWVKTGELKDGVISETEEHISELALKETSVKLLPKGTLLIAMYGQGQTRGRTGILALSATTNQACFAVQPNYELFDTYYLQFWFRHSYNRLREETEGRGGTKIVGNKCQIVRS